MEFEEMKKVWDSQHNEPVYGINEKALHNRILSKKKQGYHITNVSELLCIVAYAFTGCFIIAMNLYRQNNNVLMYILSVWMLLSAGYVLVSRLRRIKGNHRFDRSMNGDLSHAIANAGYQVRFSHLVRWNTLPIAALVVLSFMEGGKSVWLVAGMLVFFAATMYFSGWEHNIYKNKKRELELLQQKLVEEEAMPVYP
jgi:hypothetical protein